MTAELPILLGGFSDEERSRDVGWGMGVLDEESKKSRCLSGGSKRVPKKCEVEGNE